MPIKIIDLQSEDNPSGDDLVVIRENGTGTTRKITRDRFFAGVTQIINPPGSIIAYAGSIIPEGWLLCDGSPVSRLTYAGLYAAISTNFGVGDGSSTFNLPDLRGRVPVGKASSGTFVSLNNAGGAENVVLSWGQMPNHAHGVWDPGHSHYYIEPMSPITVLAINGVDHPLGHVPTRYAANTGGSGTGIGIYPAGNNEPHTNLQPYRVVNFIIKT